MPTPTEITVHQNSRALELAFDDGTTFNLPFEFLRVYSPSAEVRGHGPGQETLQVGKRNVGVSEVVPVGSYGIKLVYDDKHDSGIYTWAYLYDIGQDQHALWLDYLHRLEVAGASRD